MRVTTVFRRLIGVTKLVVDCVSFEEGAVVLAVRPRWRLPRCGECGAVRPGYDTARRRRWRRLNLGRHRILLEYAPRRVSCGACVGIRTEMVPWADLGSGFTRDFEELVANLGQVTD